MLRRLSDVTISSIEKLFGAKEEKPVGSDEKKRRFAALEADKENCVDWENNPNRLRKSKAFWDLKQQEEIETSSLASDDPPYTVYNSNPSSDSLIVDLTQITSSDMEIPSDLSAIDDYWADSADLEDLNSLSLTVLDLPFPEADYWNVIFKDLKSKELRGVNASRSEIEERHPDLSMIMRCKLIHWLFDVAISFTIQRETVHLTRTLLDSFLARSENIPRTRLQLVGLSCLLLASKLEEVQPPNLVDLSKICNRTYKESEIAVMELEICSKLQWNLSCPVSLLTWFRFYLNNLKLSGLENIDNQSFEGIADFLIHHGSILNFQASRIAAATIHIKCCDSKEIIEKCTGYKLVDLNDECAWLSIILETLEDENEAGRIASLDGAENPDVLSNEQFDDMIVKHKKALKLLTCLIKMETL